MRLLSMSVIFKFMTSDTLNPTLNANEIIALCFKLVIFDIRSSKKSLSITLGSFFSLLGYSMCLNFKGCFITVL